tara:strand:- start:1419 stop:1838 length:420 start_codon:yes stop_codon:yes gene_type:complete
MKSITLTSVQTSTGSVLASIKNFPGYFIDRDLDKVISVKNGTPKSLTIRKSGKNKMVTLSKKGVTTSIDLGKTRDSSKFRDLRPTMVANVYSKTAKLDATSVKFIRNSTLAQTELAALFDVSHATISKVVNRRTWRWVK